MGRVSGYELRYEMVLREGRERGKYGRQEPCISCVASGRAKG